jgi:transposase InsO family protein
MALWRICLRQSSPKEPEVTTTKKNLSPAHKRQAVTLLFIHLRSDNGSEFIAHVVQDWFREHGIKTIFIEPESPWQNGWIESFHARLRDERLNRGLLLNLCEARVVIEDFRRDYNEDRPHSKLGYLSPNQWIENNLQARTALGLLASLRPGLSRQTTSTKP